jgi:hypothetical protein
MKLTGSGAALLGPSPAVSDVVFPVVENVDPLAE